MPIKKRTKIQDPEPLTRDSWLRQELSMLKARLEDAFDGSEPQQSVGALIKDCAYKSKEFDGVNTVIGYKRAAKILCGESVDAVVKSRG